MGGIIEVVGGENVEVVKVIAGACVVSVGVLELAECVQCHDFLQSDLWDGQDENTIRNAQNVRCNCPLGTAGFGFYPVAAPNHIRNKIGLLLSS